MAEDNVQANIRINVDTSEALASIKNLQRQISAFHTSMANGSAANAAAAANFQKTLLDNINATKKFSATVQTVKTTTESFTNALEKNKLSLGQYFRYAGGASKTFGRVFSTEFETINKVARERVKDLQTQYIKLGRDASGALKAIAVRPLVLDMDNLATKTAIASQRQQLFNQLLKQGSTNLLNFGKNTQWAGRQLMVGFTIPLSIFGTTAAKSFMAIEEQAIKFKRVYGDLMTGAGETDAMLDSIKNLASEFTKYGVQVEKTMGLAAQAAAQGKTGADLTAQVSEATRLAVLGQVEQEQALETTISVTNAFGVAAEDLATKIDFLNAVENQTVTSIEDLTIAIPKAGPVVKQLGGNVEDLAFFLTAMKEGGINASEGANALKSGLASLINPTKRASEMLAGYGINIKGIVENNKGDVKGTVIDFANALDKLDPLDRARAIEQLFGKFQFSRLSTLFQNVIAEGTQAQRVLDLAGSTSSELAALSSRELDKVSESSMFKFKKAIEDIKVALAPVGETFLQIVTPVIEFGTKVLTAFNNLDERTRTFVAGLVAVVGGIGPVVLMTFGLLANGIANIIKGFTFVKSIFDKTRTSSTDLGSQISYMTQEQLTASAVAASLDQVHSNLIQTFTSEAGAIDLYTRALQKANQVASAFNTPAIGRSRPAQKMAEGGMVRGPGGPKDDMVPTDLSNGEAVIDAETVKKNPRIIAALFAKKKIIIPGYAENNSRSFGMPTMIKGFRNATAFLPESWNTTMGASSGNGMPAADVASYIKKAADAGMAPLMATMAKEMGIRLNDPQYRAEWEKLGNKFAESASTAIEVSGKQFIKDQDLEDIVVPALRSAAKGISVGGQQVGDALEKTLTEFRTAAAVGTQSGSSGALGRINLGGSYKGTGGAAKKYALSTGNELFREETVPSRSRGTKRSFRTLNPNTGAFETATMAHLQKSVNMTIEKMKAVIFPYLGDQSAKLMKAAGDAIVTGVKTSTRQASPSKEAYEAGENIGKGAIDGIESTVDDAQRVGRKSRRVQGIPTGNGGMTVVKVPSGPTQAETATRPRGPKRATAPQTNYDNIDLSAKNVSTSLNSVATVANKSRLSMIGLNNKLSAASIGVSALSGAAMMFGNASNEAVVAINGLSTGLFAVSSVMQMFGGTSLQDFLGGRKKKATIAARAAGAFGGDILGAVKQPGAMGAVKNFAGMIGRAGIFVARFLGPVGLAITAVTAFGAIVKYTADLQEEQRRKIEGLGDAALLTKDKLNTLGSIFGVTATQSPLEKATLTAGPMRSEDRQQVDTLRGSQEFKDKFATDIKTLTEASAAEAKIALESIAIQLEGSGFAKEQIQQIITALQEESGKTKLNLDFATISLNTKTGREILQKNAKDLVSNFGKAYANGFEEVSTTVWDELGGESYVVKNFVPTEAFKKEASTAGKTLAGMLKGVSGAFANGVIDAKEFEKSVGNVTSAIQAMPEPNQLMLMNNLLGEMDSPLATAAQGVSNLKDKYLLLQAAMLGVNTLSEGELKVLQIGPSSRAYNRVKAKLTKEIKGFKAIYDQFAKEMAQPDDPGPSDPGGDGDKSPYEKALDQISSQTIAILEQTKAFNKLKAAGYDTEKAFSIAKDPILAAALASTKVGSKQWKELTNAIKNSETAAKNFEKIQRTTLEGASAEFEKAYGNVNEAFAAATEALQLAFNSANKSDLDLIKSSESSIAALNYQIDDYNALLDDIELKEDEVNKKYDDRLEALDKIEAANENIARQQRAQLTIADALTQGDIAAAARSIQDAREEDAKSRIDAQRNSIESAREAELGGLTAGGKTRAQIEKEILSLQGQIKKIEEESLEPAQERVRLAQEKLDKDIENLKVAGKTRAEWDGIASRIRIAKTETDEFQKSINSAHAAAANLRKVLAGLTTPKVTGDEDDSDVKGKKDGKSTKTDKKLSTTDDTVDDVVVVDESEIKKSTAAFKSSGLTVSAYVKQKDAEAAAKAAAAAKAKAAQQKKDQAASASSFKASGKNLAAYIRNKASGGIVNYLANGGSPFPSLGTDTVPAMLTPGEFVVKKYAVQEFGLDKLKAINSGTYSGDSVYNYELNVNMSGSGLSADDVANTVMSKIKQINSQRIRGNTF